jgi:hypothetical protein
MYNYGNNKKLKVYTAGEYKKLGKKKTEKKDK